MKKTKIQIMMFALLCFVISGANGANNVLYEATDSPGSSPDSGGIDVWTVTGDGGSGRSFLKDSQDGNLNMWAIWDLDGGGGTYATHTFDGGALIYGQTVTMDWAHNSDIDHGDSIGIRYLDGTNSEVEFVFIGGGDWFSKYDTSSGVYELTDKRYDNYDIFQVTFALTGTNSYMITVTEGSIVDTGWKSSEDGIPDIGPVVASWEGTFTGTGITGIQIYTEGGDNSDQWFDNFEISDKWLAETHEFSPYNGEKDVLVSGLSFSWDIPQVRNSSAPGGFEAVSNLDYFNLYYNVDDPNLVGIVPVVVDTWDAALKASHTPVPGISKNSTVYWRVDTVYNDSSVVESGDLSFETELTRAVILSQPTYLSVEPGLTALFEVNVESETEVLYQWYQYVDGVSDVQLSDGGDISGATEAVLSIANVEVADEAEFYCIVNNSSGIPVTSDNILLTVKRKLAYWTFENAALDSIIPGSPASVIIGDPNFVAEGISGDALAFDQGVDMLYTAIEEVSYFDDCDYGMTVACWVKTEDKQTWCPLVAKNGEGEGWQLRQSGFTEDRPCFTTRGTGEDDGTPANRSIYDNEWHYVVGTFDGSVKKLYVDGVVSVLYSTDDGSFIKDGDQVTTPINASVSPVAIAGRVRVTDDSTEIEIWNNTAGVYDEIEIYNYALDGDTIAQNYANMTGQDVCLGQMYDLNGNCIVDLADLAIIASEWLSDAIVSPDIE